MKRAPTPVLDNLGNALAQIRVALQKSVDREPHGMTTKQAEAFRWALHKATEHLGAAAELLPEQKGTLTPLEGGPTDGA